jgi:hypothetical protein
MEASSYKSAGECMLQWAVQCRQFDDAWFLESINELSHLLCTIAAEKHHTL